MSDALRRSLEDDWLWGWDPTPGIVSVWATADGRAHVWRRVDGELLREDTRFRPWALLASLDLLAHLGPRLVPDAPDAPPDAVTWRELRGDGALRFLVRARDGNALSRAILAGASKRLGRSVKSFRDLDDDAVLSLPPEEQYLVATGRTHFRGMSFDDLRRAQFDLETTGLDPATDRVFLIALRGPDGHAEALEAPSVDDAGEAALLRAFVARVRTLDPDVIENHNLHGFDLPFLEARARRQRGPQFSQAGASLRIQRRSVNSMGGRRVVSRSAPRWSAFYGRRCQDTPRRIPTPCCFDIGRLPVASPDALAYRSRERPGLVPGAPWPGRRACSARARC